MDKNDFDFDFDFEKEFGIDPKELEGQDYDGDLDLGSDFLGGDDQLGFDLNDPIFDEAPQVPQAPQEPEASPEVQDDFDFAGLDLGDVDLDGVDLSGVDLDDPIVDDLGLDYSEEEEPAPQEAFPPQDEEMPLEDAFLEETPAAVPAEEPEQAPETFSRPERRRESRKEKRQRIRKFKEDKLPKIIAAVAAGFIAFFVLGSIIRGAINNADDKQAQSNADAISQNAAQQLDAESQRLLEEAAVLAAGYDYEGAIAKLDSFSGELSAYSEMLSKRSEYNQALGQLVAWSDPSKIPNLSFHMLIADPGRAFTDETYGKKYNQNFVTIDEFSKILQQLYDNGYVLVSMSDLFTESTSDSGVTTYAANTIYLPSGKKPIMITETLVNYLSYMIDSDGDGEADKNGDGFASRLVLDGSGNIKAEMVNSTGETIVGDYDLVPILNSFIAQNPDFSYRGARALLAVCGYEGVFGYRTNKSVVSSKGQDYYDQQVADAKKLVEALKTEGYEIACYSYENIGYGNYDATRIKTDLTSWSEEVMPILGEVDIMVYAQASDIDDYTSSKYNVLYSSGFRYFINSANAPWAEISTNYVRQSRLMVTGTNMAYYSTMFTGYFDSMSVLNAARGTVPN